MIPDDTRPNPERDQTDESLRAEREKADSGLDDQTAIDVTADEVIGRARMRADEVLAAARAKTDRRSAKAPARAHPPEAVTKERVREDEIIEQERANADETLREERAEHVALLARERDKTDEHLSGERERSDDELEARDEFLSIVSHDLRNMLNAVVGFASLIVKEVEGEHRADHVLTYARRIHRSGGRMDRLIGDLVDVASIESGTLAVTREVGDPTPVVMEIVDTFQAQASTGGVSLVSEIVEPLPLVAFDPARILQVLTNLLSNAIKFTASPGSVVLRAERIGDDVQFSVKDTGVGIPADQLEAIFVRFKQVIKNDRRGVGLGLYISRSIVLGHGGRIWAESKAGEGSLVSFTLPVHVE